MKPALLAFLISILGASTGLSAEMAGSMAFRCETPWPTATAAFLPHPDGKFHLHLKFHYGSGRIPLKVDSITPDDYPLVESSVALLRRLDTELEFAWDPTFCKQLSLEFFDCSRGSHLQKQDSTGLKIDSVSMYTSRVTESQKNVTRDRYLVQMRFTVGNNVLLVSLPYDFKDCVFGPRSSADDRARTLH